MRQLDTCAPGAPDGGRRVSCVVCAYNEAERIEAVLDAVCGHPAVSEVVVVNDGSTDGTEAVLRRRSGISLVSYAPNRGKTHALAQGIAAATGDYILLLDADLAGLDARHVAELVAPVLEGRAEVAMSLRSNSLGLYRLIGLDFVSGERVLPAALARGAVEAMHGLPPWGGEAHLNALVIERGLRLAVVDWPGVRNVRKGEKVGAWRGLVAELRMVRDAVTVLSPWGVVRQNVALLSLKQGRGLRSGRVGRRTAPAWTRHLDIAAVLAARSVRTRSVHGKRA